VRDFARRARGSKVPTFITAGYLDVNTNIGGGTTDFYNALRGPRRMWLGWWDHVRGAELSGERLAMGRPGFYDEVMRFYDQYVKGEDTATEADPVIAAQSSDGRWREETRWPPHDVKPTRFAIAEGGYADDGANEGSGDAGAGAGGAGAGGGEMGHGSWTFSEPFEQAVQVAGDPVARVELSPQVPRTNLVVNVYDVAPDGAATMITRGARLADREGAFRVELFPTDWVVAAGHRIGILVSGANAEAYTHVPTHTTVFVAGGWVKLPLLATPRTPDLEGTSNPRLERYLEDAPFPVP
jgi:predicted acyl esterase